MPNVRISILLWAYYRFFLCKRFNYKVNDAIVELLAAETKLL